MLLGVLLLLSVACAGRGSPRLFVGASRAAGQLQAGSGSPFWLQGAGGAAAASVPPARHLAQAAAAAGCADVAPALAGGQALAKQVAPTDGAGGAAVPTSEQLQEASSNGGENAPAAELGQAEQQLAGQEAEIQPCLNLQSQFSAGCQVAIDRLALYFPRGSTEPPTDEQREQALGALKAGGLPSKGCCQGMDKVLAARCGCNRYGHWLSLPVAAPVLPCLAAARCAPRNMNAQPVNYLLFLPASMWCSMFLERRAEVELVNPALTPAYLQGANYLVALSCAAPDPTCA